MADPDLSPFLRNPEVPKWLVVGEVGDGKSTLVNALCGGRVANAGMDPEGVTKQPQFHLSACREFVLIDTPGIGDLDISMTELVALLEAALESVQVHGVIVCSKTYTRIQIGGQIITKIVNVAFKDPNKWNSVIFNFTHADRASEEERMNLPRVIDTFCTKVLQGTTRHRPRHSTSQCGGPAGSEDTSELRALMQQVRRNSTGIGDYTRPDSQCLAQIICSTTGDDVAVVTKQVEDLRAIIAQLHEEMLRQQFFAQQQQCAMQGQLQWLQMTQLRQADEQSPRNVKGRLRWRLARLFGGR